MVATGVVTSTVRNVAFTDTQVAVIHSVEPK